MKITDYSIRLKELNGSSQRRYYLDMPGAPSSLLADIFAFDGIRGIGEPTKYTITFTHPSHRLSRDEYVGKPANFVIQPRPITEYGFTKVEPPSEVKGVVTSFAWKGSSRDQSTYEIVLESRLALLRNTPKVRFFYDLTIAEVLMQVLKDNGFDHLHASVEFLNLHHTYRKRPIITQWEQDDLSFIDYLCRRAGIWYVCESTEHGEAIVFGDDLTHYLRDDGYNMPYRPESGLYDGGVEAVETLTMRANSIPKSYFVRSYNPENGYEPVDASLVIHNDKTTYGEAYTYGLPYLTREDAADEVRIQQQAALAGQIVYEGETNKLVFAPRYVVKLTNRPLADAEHGLLIVRMHVSASRKEGYKVRFTAIPNELERPYRMPLKRETWPRIAGTITGTIASPNDYAHPFITRLGGYVVQLHADRDPRTPGANSCVMYVAKPYAGKHYTGMHFGLVDGTLVAIAFYQGNPDLPYIAHALHSSVHPDPINSSDRWLSRDTIHFRSNNTIESENWEDQEHLKLSTEHGKSQLNLGHTVGKNPERRHRGSGFELRSDMRGAVRAGDGLLLSAEKQAKASGDVVDMTGARQVFQRTQEEADALMQAVAAARAEVADLKAERQWMKEALAELKQQVIALSAPAGIGMATPDRVSIAAGKDVNVATSQGFNVSAIRHVTMAAREKLSLFAYQSGIGVRAARGPVQMEAHSDVMSLAAQKNMTITSGEGAVHVRADRDIMLECGGAFIEIKDGNMILGGPGKLIFKFAGMKKDSAQMGHLAAPTFATTAVPFKTSCAAWLSGNTTVAKVSPVPQLVDWKQFANGAPEPLADGAPSADVPEADHDSEHEPKLSATPKDQTPEPIKLEKRVWCDWKLKKLTKEVATETETGSYNAADDDGNAVRDSKGQPKLVGAVMPTNFHLDYDPDSQTVTATVRIKIRPVDLLKTDPFGKLILIDGKTQSVPYHHDYHWDVVSSGIDRPNSGFVLQYRDSVGSDFNLAAQKSRVENVLNSHRSLLILDGCSRGAACGCRVNVKFKVDFLLSVKDARVGDFHKEVWLFPRSRRADATCWGEVNGFVKDDVFTPSATGNVVAHECGHLFNYPDEYWMNHGWVHKSYIKENHELDFDKGKGNVGRKVWQIESRTNLMGYGATSPNATVSPNYLEYVRRQFFELSNKKWKIGYEG